MVNASADVEAYRRLAAAMEEWTAILRPGGWTRRPGELLDELSDELSEEPLEELSELPSDFLSLLALSSEDEEPDSSPSLSPSRLRLPRP